MTNEEAVNVLRIMASGIELKGYSDHWILNFREAYETALKSLENERPQGEWIITGEEQGAFGITYKIRKCDKCGWEHSLVIPKNFCSNCGADMRGKENEKL